MDLVVEERVASESAREYVYKTLKSNIMSLDLKPGTNITEKDVSEYLNISRTPVREALIKLSQEDLLHIYPQKGTVVSLIDLDNVLEAVFIRKTLECEIIGSACKEFSEKLLLEMKANVHQIEFLIQQPKVSILSIFNLDASFHKAIFTGTKNTLAWSVIKQISSHLDRARILKLLTISNAWQNVIALHSRIIDAIAKHNPTDGIALMESHIGHFDSDATGLYGKHREYFKKH